MDTTAARLYPAEPAEQITADPIAGRYRIHARIGRGRLGEIYEASDERHRQVGVDRRVAIQLVTDAAALDETRFAEIKAGYARLLVQSHPNIVDYHDVGHDGRFGYVVMDLLEGASLRTILDLEAPLLLTDTTAVLSAVGGALEFLHAKSITHGRVVPENVFVTDDLEFRLLDVLPLSGARPDAPGAGRDGKSPHEGVADDLYGLACLAYEMLTGTHPYNFQNRHHAAASGLVPQRIDSLPEPQWRALNRELSFDDSQKPRWVADFLRDFGIRGNERLQASPAATASTPSAAPKPAGKTSPAGAQNGDRRRLPRTETMRADRDTRRARRPRETSSLILFIALLALGAWFAVGQPQVDVAALFDAVGPRIDAEVIASNSAVSRIPLPETTALTPAAPEDGTANIADTRSAGNALPNPEPANTGPADADAIETAAPVSQPDATAVTEARLPPAPTESTVSGNETLPSFDRTYMTVSEGDTVARLSVQLPDTPVTELYSWTRSHGAQADVDFVAISAQPVRADSADGVATILVPLVNDGMREPVEDFFVHVGARDADGRLVPADTIRVDIVDDD